MINDDIRCNTNNYQKGRNSKIKYIVVHYTASPNDTAEGEAKYFKNNIIEASAHYFVDGKSVYRSVMDSDTAWHCGANKYFHNECRNDNSIGVEMCCKKHDMSTKNASDKDWYFDKKTVENAAKFTRELMKRYDIPVDRVIRHYDVTHKVCPAPFVHNEEDWGIFKEMLKGDDSEVVEVGKININGKNYEIKKIFKGEQNYVCLADLQNMGFDVGYSAVKKIPSLGVKAEKVKMSVNGSEREVARILKFDENYIRLRDLADILDINYVDGIVQISSKT